MKNRRAFRQTGLTVNVSTEGETMEQRVRRLVQQGENLTDGAPMIYTDRKDGVLAGYNPRTDRFEVGAELTEKAAKSTVIQREARMNIVPKDGEDTGGEPIQTTK